MIDYRPEYCQLLRKQVEEELAYLNKIGHVGKNPVVQCIFCAEYKSGLICNRNEQLSKFLSEITIKINQSPSKSFPKVDAFSPSKNNLMPLIGFSS